MTTKLPIIIDCDPGVDDAIALLLALASPELEVRAITTVAGNVPGERTLDNGRRVVALSGRTEVPVHAGCVGPLLGPVMRGKYSGAGGLGGTLLPEATVPLAAGHAVDVLTAELSAAAAAGKPITLCTLGPLTNVAVALARDPSLVRGIAQVVCMAGAFVAGGNRTPTAEFNVLADPHAAEIVFRSGAPIVLAPLDVTFQALATPARVAALRGMGGRITQLAAELITFYDRNDPARYGEPGGPLHDPCVIAYLLKPDLFGFREANVSVELTQGLCYGQTVGDFFNTTDRPRNAKVLSKLDAQGFFDLLWERLASY
ncbi:nucleoside hydrolase [Roseomonas aerophila]|uniref:Nucleoside hydrolase n=1 Tax=Teichococcus aerophilus TaxID=1224513 RepID=A0ABR7RJU1_9PROT|nr:nucleoside hydrolase [Pseudoroseomonas aerophila]MBC9206673.1 nucleoside hydrolase [Pseudoroseomonas aerophila]